MGRKILIASEGMVLTDGKVYCNEIHLAEDRSADEFYEITQAEYEEIMAEETDVLAENEDMKSALKLLGVE